MTYIQFYLIDLLMARATPEVTWAETKKLSRQFQTKGSGEVKHNLGVYVGQERFCFAEINIFELLEDNGPLGTKPIATPLKMGFAPREEVEIEKNKLCWKPMRSLLYIAKVSWPDIAVAAGLLYESLESHLLCERRFDSWQEIAEAVIG